MNIDSQESVIEDNILDIYQQENQNDTFGCVMCKKNSTYKVYLYVERSNEVTSNLLQKEFPLTKMENAKAYFNKLKELVRLKDLFEILKCVSQESV